MFEIEIAEEMKIQANKSKKFSAELELKDRLWETYNELPFHNGYNNFNDFVIATIGRELDL